MRIKMTPGDRLNTKLRLKYLVSRDWKKIRIEERSYGKYNIELEDSNGRQGDRRYIVEIKGNIPSVSIEFNKEKIHKLIMEARSFTT